LTDTANRNEFLSAMSAEIIPLPAPQPTPAPSAAITPLPPPVSEPEEDSLSKLLKNPLVIAGGAMLAGMALTRLFSTSPMRKLARDLADEALKRARSSAEPPSSPSLLEQGIEAVRPQITEAAKRFLAEILRKS
jgi:hypothetical protein